MLKKATGFLAQIPGGDWNHGLFDDFFLRISIQLGMACHHPN
jgi:hypothetical protein